MSDLNDMAEALAPTFRTLNDIRGERNELARRLFNLGEDVPEQWLGSNVDPLGDWAAAREAVCALFDNGERLKWCEEHRSPFDRESVRLCEWAIYRDRQSLVVVNPCRIVSRLLIDPLEIA